MPLIFFKIREEWGRLFQIFEILCRRFLCFFHFFANFHSLNFFFFFACFFFLSFFGIFCFSWFCSFFSFFLHFFMSLIFPGRVWGEGGGTADF